MDVANVVNLKINASQYNEYQKANCLPDRFESTPY